MNIGRGKETITMANKFLGGNTSTNPEFEEYLSKMSLADALRLAAQKEAEQKRECHHTQFNNARLVPIKQSNVSNAVKERYSDSETVVVCSGEGGCGEIIDIRVYSKEELRNGIFMFRSVLNQIQIMISERFDNVDEKQMIDGFVALEYLEKMSTKVYGELRDAQEKHKEFSKGAKKSNKGNVGLNSHMFG